MSSKRVEIAAAVALVFVSQAALAAGWGDDLAKKAQKVRPSGRATLDNASKKEELENPQKITPGVIDSLGYLIKSTPSGPQRQLLVINRARAMNIHVRQLLLGSKRLDLTPAEKNYLRVAVTDLNEVLKSPNLNRDLREKGLKALGFAHTYLGESGQGKRVFQTFLKEFPKSKDAGWVAIYVAEEFFSEGQFDEAARYYRGFYNSMNNAEKELAYYKLAWCFINAQKMPQAEELFRRVIQFGRSQQGLAKDAIRDLAFLVAHHPKMEDSLKMADDVFENNSAGKIEFLNYVRASYESQNNYAAHAMVMDRIFQIETDPERKFQLLLANLRVNRREFASKVHISAYNRLVQFMEAEKINKDNPIFTKASVLLENELQTLLKSWIDTFGGRTKTPERIKREDIPRELSKVYSFYDGYFPNSKLRVKLFEIRMDMCSEVKDWSCVLWSSDNLFAEAERKGGPVQVKLDVIERAGQLQLEAFEQLMKTPGADVAAMKERYFQMTRKLYSWSRRFSGWEAVAKRYCNALLERKQYPEAVQVMENIYVIEKSQDAFYRLQSARFEAGQYAQIVEDTRSKATDPRLVEIKREASLKMAMKGRESDQIDVYQRNLQNFLRYNPDPGKAAIARADYFKFLVEKSAYTELASEIKGLSLKERTRPEYQDAVHRTWRYLMDTGEFAAASQMANGEMKRLLAVLCQDRDEFSPKWSNLLADDREYLLGVLVLSRPKIVLKYADSKKVKLSVNEKAIAHLALRLTEGEWSVSRTPEGERLLGKDFPFRIKAGVTLPFERKLEAIRFPKDKGSAKKFAAVFAKIAGDVAAIRKTVAKDLPGKAASDQIRALKKAVDVENEVARQIKESPIPEKLGEKQLEEYKKGLDEAALEYENQAKEYEKLISSIESASKEKKDQEEAKMSSGIPVVRWPWPGVAEEVTGLKTAKTNALRKNLSASLVLLDLVRDEAKLPPDVYAWLRTGFVLAASPHGESAVLKRYLAEELKKTGQDGVLSEWMSQSESGDNS